MNKNYCTTSYWKTPSERKYLISIILSNTVWIIVYKRPYDWCMNENTSVHIVLKDKKMAVFECQDYWHVKYLKELRVVVSESAWLVKRRKKNYMKSFWLQKKESTRKTILDEFNDELLIHMTGWKFEILPLNFEHPLNTHLGHKYVYIFG